WSAAASSPSKRSASFFIARRRSSRRPPRPRAPGGAAHTERSVATGARQGRQRFLVADLPQCFSGGFGQEAIAGGLQHADQFINSTALPPLAENPGGAHRGLGLRVAQSPNQLGGVGFGVGGGEV